METIPAKTISAPEVSKTPIAPTDKKMLTENMHPATEVTPGENVSTKEKTETPEISSNQVNLHLSPEAKKDIGNQIWKNEAGGTVEGLTTWNKGETFASLGIGHFLWLPENSKAPYDDKFKSLLKYMEDKKIKMPSWLTSNTPNPWKTKEEFDRDFNTPKMKELRDFLTTTIPMQTEFIVDRIEQSLPKMIENADPSKSQQIKDNFAKVLNSGAPGVFALTDYVNFK